VAGCGSRSTPRYGGRCEGVCVGGLADLGRNAWKSETRSKVADWRPWATLEQITRFPGGSSAPGYFFLIRGDFLYVVPVMSRFSVGGLDLGRGAGRPLHVAGDVPRRPVDARVVGAGELGDQGRVELHDIVLPLVADDGDLRLDLDLGVGDTVQLVHLQQRALP